MRRQFELPKNWRESLPPNPADFYRQHIPGLDKPDELGAVRGVCPFHLDSAPTIVLDAGGGWRCFGKCGSGDLVEFTIRLQTFSAAVRELIGEGG